MVTSVKCLKWFGLVWFDLLLCFALFCLFVCFTVIKQCSEIPSASKNNNRELCNINRAVHLRIQIITVRRDC